MNQSADITKRGIVPDFTDISFQAIVDQSLAGIYVLQDECFQYVNEIYAAMTGYTQREMIGMNLRQSVHPDHYEEVMALYNQRISGEIPAVRFVTWGAHKEDGRLVRIEVQGSRMEYRGRPAVVGVAIDVTERLQREEELRQSRAELQALTAHIITIREEQRVRYARELHDVLGGMLTSIKMDVARILRRATTPDLQEISRNLLALTQETIDTVRNMSEELHPAALAHLGLSAAMERELLKFAERSNIKCDFELQELPIEISFNCATGIYRIFQEALTNIARHSEARTVTVYLSATAAEVILEIIDDGRGIDPQANRQGSLGIISMRERARELGGTLNIGNHAGRGTRLYLQIPIPDTAD